MDTQVWSKFEFSWKGARWELVDLAELQRRMAMVTANPSLGPVSHASPGALSGIDWQKDIAPVVYGACVDQSIPDPTAAVITDRVATAIASGDNSMSTVDAAVTDALDEYWAAEEDRGFGGITVSPATVQRIVRVILDRLRQFGIALTAEAAR